MKTKFSKLLKISSSVNCGKNIFNDMNSVYFKLFCIVIVSSEGLLFFIVFHPERINIFSAAKARKKWFSYGNKIRDNK